MRAVKADDYLVDSQEKVNGMSQSPSEFVSDFFKWAVTAHEKHILKKIDFWTLTEFARNALSNPKILQSVAPLVPNASSGNRIVVPTDSTTMSSGSSPTVIPESAKPDILLIW